MKLTKDQVRHVAKLARLKLTEKEVELYAKQLSSVLEYMDILNEVDTAGVLPTAQVTGLKNVYREDKVKKVCEREELLASTELPVEGDQIRVKAVF